MLDIHFDNAETITAEAGAMVYMQGDIEIKTKTREGGGFLRKLKVSVLGGQSFFVNNYVANSMSIEDAIPNPFVCMYSIVAVLRIYL